MSDVLDHFVTRSSGPDWCSVSEDCGERAIRLVVGDSEQLGGAGGIFACEEHLEAAIDMVHAPATVWPA